MVEVIVGQHEVPGGNKSGERLLQGDVCRAGVSGG